MLLQVRSVVLVIVMTVLPSLSNEGGSAESECGRSEGVAEQRKRGKVRTRAKRAEGARRRGRELESFQKDT
jgi:hypothetical protein